MSASRPAVEAWLEPYRPGVDGPWGEREASHLLRRTSFGGTLEERGHITALGPEAAASHLTDTPPVSGEYADTLAALTVLETVDELETAQAIWLTRMLTDPRPFREVLALFWHGHFATSVSKVERTRLLVRQVATLRELGGGPLRDLVVAMSRDPAMIVWLDGNANRRHHPNENFARELMELFTLGVGHYDEHDVLEAARAFTGWHEHRDRFRFNAHEHDEGDKVVLGQSGNLDGEDVIDACLAQAACGRHVGGRLFRYFVRPDPEPELLELIGERYRESGYDTRAFVTMLVASRAFYEARARRSIVKSPVALAVGVARSLGLRPDSRALASRLAGLGQSLYAPPSVKGWDAGRSWLNAATLVGRVNLAADLARAAADASVLADDSRPPAEAFIDRLLDGELPERSIRERLSQADPTAVLQTVIALPEAQLA